MAEHKHFTTLNYVMLATSNIISSYSSERKLSAHIMITHDHRAKQTDRGTDGQTDGQMNIQTGRQTDRQRLDRRRDGQKDKTKTQVRGADYSIWRTDKGH